MDIKKALELADFCENEGVVSTTTLALRCLARAYQEAKTELDLIEFEKQRPTCALLKQQAV